MRKIFLSAFVLLSLGLHAQDIESFLRIDSITRAIDNAGYRIEHDTIRNDQPELKLFMITYLTMISNGHELKKYVNNVHITRTENGETQQMETTNIFYFDEGNLIKVEDLATNGDKNFQAHWYYEKNKPLYETPPTEESAERSAMLLKIGQTLLAKIHL